MPGSLKERRNKLSAFLKAAKQKVNEVPRDHLYGMTGKIALMRDWRDRARHLLNDFYSYAFSFFSTCFVVIVDKRLNSKFPIFLVLVQKGEPVEFGQFIFEYNLEGSVMVRMENEKGSWVCGLTVDKMKVERDGYIIRAFSENEKALKWLKETMESVELYGEDDVE